MIEIQGEKMEDSFEAMESTRSKQEILSKIVSMPSNYVVSNVGYLLISGIPLKTRALNSIVYSTHSQVAVWYP